MLNAIAFSLLMAAQPDALIAPALVQPSTIEWALDGHALWNFEDGAPMIGVTYTPDVDFPLGITVMVTRVEWEDTFTRTDVHFYRHHDDHYRAPTFRTTTKTEERDDTRAFVGVTWRFR